MSWLVIVAVDGFGLGIVAHEAIDVQTRAKYRIEQPTWIEYTAMTVNPSSCGQTHEGKQV